MSAILSVPTIDVYLLVVSSVGNVNPESSCHRHGGRSTDCSPWVVSNRSSNSTWNCGDTNPVRRLRIRPHVSTCSGEFPKYIPSLTWGSHLSIFCLFCSRPSKAYTGQPNGWSWDTFGRNFVLVNILSGVLLCLGVGVLFSDSVAAHTDNGSVQSIV
jgi:hypothetical protein